MRHGGKSALTLGFTFSLPASQPHYILSQKRDSWGLPSRAVLFIAECAQQRCGTALTPYSTPVHRLYANWPAVIRLIRILSPALGQNSTGRVIQV